MTIKDIAGLAGVSISTVSKIINNKDADISLETRNHVLKIAKEYNYVPYSSIKNSSNAKTFILGVMLKSFSQDNLLLSGILTTAQEHGYTILVCDSTNSLKKELLNISALCKNHIDGLIWEPVSAESSAYLHHFKKMDIPVCYINSSFEPNTYNIDFEQAGYQATDFLLNYKHQKIACVIQSDSEQSRQFFEGFRKCLFKHQIRYTDSMKLIIDKEDCCAQILAQRLTGIVSAHFPSSLSIYRQLTKFHYQLPNDLSIISLREDAGEDVLFSEISNIKLPYFEFGKYVCEKLIAACEKNNGDFKNFTTDFHLEHEASLTHAFITRNLKIVIVGSINIDVTLNVDELPLSGRTISTNKYSVFPGGKGTNQAIGVAKLGHRVSLLGKVGNDFDAALVYAAMEENHVDSVGITRDNNASTGKAYIHVQNDGESTISILAGANATISGEDIRKHAYIFENAGYCLLQTEISAAAIEAAAVLAKKCGAKTILKPAAQKSIPDSLLKYIDILVPNEIEINILCPHTKDRSKQADYFLKKGVEIVIITLGNEGCYVKTAGYEKSFPAISFVSIDNTGAADAFIAALASYLLYGYSLEKSVQIATYAAGFCISRQGVVPALIDRNSLESYIKRTEPNLLIV